MKELTLEKFDQIMSDYVTIDDDILHVRRDFIEQLLHKRPGEAFDWLKEHATPLEYEGWWEIRIKKQ